MLTGNEQPSGIPIASVCVGPRFRRDLGDLEGLIESIGALGLLHPVVVDRGGRLVAGLRRLRACEALGWTSVPVTVVDLDGRKSLRAEHDENAVRKDFLPSEAVAIARAMRETEQAAARDRQLAGLRRGQKSARAAKLAERGEARDRLAAAGDMSHGTLAKAEAVVAAAETDPAAWGPLVAAMDESGNVHGAWRQLQSGRLDTTVLASESVEWYTPAIYIEAARAVMGGIDVDPASSTTAQETVQAARWFGRSDDGLRQEWLGRVWLNPPYGGVAGDWVRKLLVELGCCRTTQAIVLLNGSAMETAWFWPLWDYTLCVHEGRIAFISPSGQSRGPTHGSVFAYIGGDARRFAEVFGEYGAVVRRWP